MMQSKTALTLFGILFVMSACQNRKFNSGDSSEEGFFKKNSESKALGQETLEENEPEKIQKIIDSSLVLMKKNAAPDGVRRREVHSKGNGCLRGKFEVDKNLPDDWSTGIFKKGATYPLWARVSNGAPGVGKDSDKQTSRGFALKLMNVPGQKVLPDLATAETQDFLLVNGRRFFIRDLETYIRFLDATNNERTLSAFLDLNPLKWKVAELFALLERTRLKIANPVEVPYFSAVPYKYLNGAAKYKIEPCAGSPDQNVPKNAPDNYLKLAMKESLKKDVCYNFIVMQQTDAQKQPIEDSTVEWKPEETNTRQVATITFPAQNFDTPENDEMCEQLSFHPWHALPEHQPLGNMNRARREVYTALSKARHEENKAPSVEPTPDARFSVILK